MAAASSALSPSGSISINNGSGRNHNDTNPYPVPTGSCNFRDLAAGLHAPTCGCTRFWLNSGHANAPDPASDRTWCFCGHHACFHNAFGRSQQAPIPAFSTLDDAHHLSFNPNPLLDHTPTPSRPAGLGIDSDLTRSRQQQSPTRSINTRTWEALNAFAREQDESRVAVITSRLPSTATPSIADDEMRTGTERLLQDQRSKAPPLYMPSTLPVECDGRPPSEQQYSATEVATPSIAGTPDMRAFLAPALNRKESLSNLPPTQFRAGPAWTAQHAKSAVQRTRSPQSHPAGTVPLTTSDAPLNVSANEIHDLLRAHGRRLEILESLSFSHVPAEDVHEKFELFEGRLLDMEQWRTEREEAHATSPDPPSPVPSTVRSQVLLPAQSGLIGIDGSFDSNAAMYTEATVMATLVANSETVPLIDALESRVASLEAAALPTFGRPWNVEVVVLPWGRELQGIWFSSTESSLHHSMKSSMPQEDEWAPNPPPTAPSFRSHNSTAWTTESIQDWCNDTENWLSPKACGPSGTVFRRLESRGLVQALTFTAPDARHVLDVINSAFGYILEDNTPYKSSEASEASTFLGLREKFVPLRKVQRSSRLRLLSPAEMLSSACWTASLLDSSLCMKINDGQKRLYITTPHAYLQSHCIAWSWPRIRALPLFRASSDEKAAQAGRIAIEACWTYNERLDRALSPQSSFASQISHGGRSQSGESDKENQAIKSQSVCRTSLQKITSLPSTIPGADSAETSITKRRGTSFGAVSASLGATSTATAFANKRRRVSASPEAERRGVGLTPRYSREPPSPFMSEITGDASSQAAHSRTGTTPFAYATPHSNNNFIELMVTDGDTEADPEDLAVGSSVNAGDDEWQGVGEESLDEDDMNEGELRSYTDDEDMPELR